MGFNSDVRKDYGGLSWHMATGRPLLRPPCDDASLRVLADVHVEEAIVEIVIDPCDHQQIAKSMLTGGYIHTQHAAIAPRPRQTWNGWRYRLRPAVAGHAA